MGSCCSSMPESSERDHELTDGRESNSAGDRREEVGFAAWLTTGPAAPSGVCPSGVSSGIASCSQHPPREVNLASITIHNHSHRPQVTENRNLASASARDTILEGDNMLPPPSPHSHEDSADVVTGDTTEEHVPKSPPLHPKASGDGSGKVVVRRHVAAVPHTTHEHLASGSLKSMAPATPGWSRSSDPVHDSMIQLPVLECCASPTEERAAAIATAAKVNSFLLPDSSTHGGTTSTSPPGATSTLSNTAPATISPPLRFAPGGSFASHPCISSISMSASQPSHPQAALRSPRQTAATDNNSGHTVTASSSVAAYHPLGHQPLSVNHHNAASMATATARRSPTATSTTPAPAMVQQQSFHQRADVSMSRLSTTMISKVDISFSSPPQTIVVTSTAVTPLSHQQQQQVAEPDAMIRGGQHRNSEASTVSALYGAGGIGFSSDVANSGDFFMPVASGTVADPHHSHTLQQQNLRVHIQESLDMDTAGGNHPSSSTTTAVDSVATDETRRRSSSKGSLGAISPLNARARQFSAPSHVSQQLPQESGTTRKQVLDPLSPGGAVTSAPRVFPKTRTIVQDNRYGPNSTPTSFSVPALPQPSSGSRVALAEPPRMSDLPSSAVSSPRGQAPPQTQVEPHPLLHAQIMQMLAGGGGKSSATDSLTLGNNESFGAHHYESFAPLQMPSHLWPQ